MYSHYRSINGEIRLGSGTAVPLNNVLVISYNGRSFVKKKASYIYRERVKQLFELTTERGKQLRITGRHKLLTIDENGMEWKPVASLAPNSYVAIPKILEPPVLNLGISEEDAYFLGLFVAEGSFNPLAIYNKDKNLVKKLIRYVKRKFGYTPTVREKNGVFQVLLRKPTREFLHKLGLKNRKTVPTIILQSSPGVVKNFIDGYIDGDGYVSASRIEIITKDEEICNKLCYLLNRLAVNPTVRRKVINGKTYYRIYIVGRERSLFGMKPRSSKHNYPKLICRIISNLYRKTLGSNRGSKRKVIGKRSVRRYVYDILVGSVVASIGESTLTEIIRIFKRGLRSLKKSYSYASRLESLSDVEFREMIDLLPFPFTKLEGFKQTTLQNYPSRTSVPTEIAEKLKFTLMKKLGERIHILKKGIELLESIRLFNWERVTDLRTIPYDDYVYDLVVPGTHNFVGGNYPFLLHNTQIGFQLAVTVQLPLDKRGLERGCLWIDTENTFSPNRIVSIAKTFNLNPDEILKRVFVARAYNVDHQIFLVEKAPEMIEKNDIGLIVIDSLNSHFRAEFIGRGELARRQQKLNKHLHELQRLADRFNLAVYVTNQVMAAPDVLFGDPTRPVGGHVLGHMSFYRIYLRRGRGGTRIARLVDAPDLPEGERVFKITERGVEDA